MRRFVLCAACGVWLAASPPICWTAAAEPPSGIPISDLSFGFDDSLFYLDIDAYGAAYAARQSVGVDRDGLTGALLLQPEIGHPFDNGWDLGVKTAFLAYHDRLSGDDYGDDVVEMAYGYLQTGYGRIEVGQVDGAAYRLEVTGPLVAGPPAIDDGNVAFFIDPKTGAAFTNIFPVRTGAFATANDAKISYYSPRTVDLQIGVSFTPSETKGFPFFSHAQGEAVRQRDIAEAGANYAHGFGRRIVLHAYAGLAFGQAERHTLDSRNALDWALGAELDYKLDWATVAVGGAYRRSRGYTFDIDRSFAGGNTYAYHATARAIRGPWQFGLEYSRATADAAGALPGLKERGFEPVIGYTLNRNLQLVAGYQHLNYSRNSGSFYNGKRDLSLAAAFLYLEFKV